MDDQIEIIRNMRKAKTDSLRPPPYFGDKPPPPPRFLLMIAITAALIIAVIALSFVVTLRPRDVVAIGLLCVYLIYKWRKA